MSARTTETIGIYTVHALRIGKTFRARALAGDMRVADGEGDSVAAAIASVRDKLDLFRPSREAEIPLAGEYAHALALLGRKVTAAQWAMLRAHAAAPGRSMTATQLAAAGGFADVTSANLWYGKLGTAIAKLLDMPLPKRANGKAIATCALAHGSGEGDEVLWTWTMHEQLGQTIDAMTEVDAPPAYR